MAKGETQVCDERALDLLLGHLALKVALGRHKGAGAPLVLIGIRSRGVPLAERLAQRVGEATGEPARVGAVDITLYRDDLGKGDRWPILRGTDIPFDVDGCEVVLVDDVLYTGRTVRAAMNCVCDLGRPAAVRLAVLVDRGGRELPVQADYSGLILDVRQGERVRVRLRPTDPTDEVVLVAAP